jgi:integrase/recombinase XerD
LWRYLAEREDGEDPDAPLFLGKFHRVFNRDALFTLKALLVHGSLAMVEYYARIAEVDIKQAYRKASPADNWRL